MAIEGHSRGPMLMNRLPSVPMEPTSASLLRCHHSSARCNHWEELGEGYQGTRGMAWHRGPRLAQRLLGQLPAGPPPRARLSSALGAGLALS